MRLLKDKKTILIAGFVFLAVIAGISTGNRGDDRADGGVALAGPGRSSSNDGQNASQAEGNYIAEKISANASTEDMYRATAGFTMAMNNTLIYDRSGEETGEETSQPDPNMPDSDDPEVMETYLAQANANSVENLWGYKNLGIAHVDNHLNVRKKPSEEGELVGKMTKGAACEILEVDGDWAHIKSGSVDGYVHMDYLYTGDEARDKAQEFVYLKAVVNTQTLKVRDEPSTDSPVITLVARKERLEIVDLDTPGWARIMLDDEKAYVSTDYCIIEQQLDTAVSQKELMFGSGVSETRVSLVAYAKQFIGNPYVWGGTSLTKGADCSGFVLSVFKKYGVSLPRTSREQAKAGTGINLSEARPGDLIFYAKGGTINHVAIYIGNGQVVHASNPRSGIKISNATYRTPARIRRVLK